MSELKGLTKKLLFSILPRKKANCKSIVAMVFECYFFVTSSCIVMYMYVSHSTVVLLCIRIAVGGPAL